MSSNLNSIIVQIKSKEWSMRKLALSFLISFLLIAILLPSYWIAITTDSASLRKFLLFPQRAFSKSAIHEVPLICSANMSLTCPGNHTEKFNAKTLNSQTCPDYFRWIHEDLNPWKKSGITRDLLENAKTKADFRLIIVDGKAFVDKYRQPYQTRNVFTLWGILQLMKMYPRKLPDLDLMFQCGDVTVIKKKDYQVIEDSSTNSTLPFPPPMFHYCGDDSSFDIVFPDWTFWGWIETQIKPWENLVEDLKGANEKVKWVKREPYAFWKGNLYNGHRDDLAKCNSTKDWNAQIYNIDWGLEAKQGYKDAKMTAQCKHKYRIYMEGNAWSVSRKYIMACDSMNLVITPSYYDFFSRNLIPLNHYWPIDPNGVCSAIKFAVDWGNKHPKEAEEMGRAGSKYIQEELKMKHVYDYMYHLLNEYAKLMKYKPTVPPTAVELCSATWACASNNTIEEDYKLNTLVNSASVEAPCSMPPPYDPIQLQEITDRNANIIKQVKLWESKESK